MSASAVRPPLPWWLEEGAEACCACATLHHLEACHVCAECDALVCATCARDDPDEPGVTLCPACLEEAQA